MNDKNFFYVAGAFLVLVVAFSMRKTEYQEVKELPSETLSFDSNVLPSVLKPPSRLSENEEMPELASPRRFSGNKSRK